MADFIYMMESRLTPEQLRVAGTIQEIARAHEMNVYLTGGAVRDIISGFSIRDLDFTVQGNVMKLQKDLQKAGAIIQGSDENVRILYALFPPNVRVEIASARAETYPRPGRPEVKFETINEDLRRRDFTINAMALSLNPGSRGLLMDPFNGVADIEAKQLRILQNYAFLEEPSRMLRAVRLMTRFHWTLEERTQARFDAAKENNYLEYLTNRTIGYELEQIAHEDDPLATIRAFEKEGWMKLLYPAWTSGKADVASLEHLQRTREQLTNIGVYSDPAAARMYFLTKKMSDSEVKGMQKLMPRQHFVELWRNIEDDAKELAKQLTAKEFAQPSAAWKLMMSSRPELIIFLDITSRQSAVTQRIKDFLTKWPTFRQKMPILKMTEMRIVPELPIYRQLLEEMFLMMLDGKLKTEAEIVKYLEPHSPPLPVVEAPARRGRAKKKTAKAPAKAAKPSAAPAAADAVQGQPAAAAAAPAPANGKAAKAQPPAKAQPAAKAAAGSAGQDSAKPVAKAPAKQAAAPAPPAKAAKTAPAKPAASKPAPAKAASKPASKPAPRKAAKPAPRPKPKARPAHKPGKPAKPPKKKATKKR
jgi:tRNA nucleotidyltransferase (CCA-adding enzyme)